MPKKSIETDGAAKAIGPYSQAVRHGRLLFCSGQLGIDPATNPGAGMLGTGATEAFNCSILRSCRMTISRNASSVFCCSSRRPRTRSSRTAT